MAILPIRRVPDPILKQPVPRVDRVDRTITALITSLIATMRHHPRCVGLAAPQVGKPLRIAVMDSSRNPKVETSRGLLVLVNPQIEEPEASEVRREGCLSIPDFTANVRRALRLHLKAWDQFGSAYELRLEGFEAVIAQHEVDHLDGTLFLDRVANTGADLFHRKDYAQ